MPLSLKPNVHDNVYFKPFVWRVWCMITYSPLDKRCVVLSTPVVKIFN